MLQEVDLVDGEAKGFFLYLPFGENIGHVVDPVDLGLLNGVSGIGRHAD